MYIHHMLLEMNNCSKGAVTQQTWYIFYCSVCFDMDIQVFLHFERFFTVNARMRNFFLDFGFNGFMNTSIVSFETSL